MTVKFTLLWFLLCLGVLVGVGTLSWQRAAGQLAGDATNIETRLAEKLAQHDAHLTALAAVIRMEPQANSPSVQGLATAIAEFYPRIRDITTLHPDGSYSARYVQSVDQLPQAGNPTPAPPSLSTPGSTAVRLGETPGSYDLYKLVSPGTYLRVGIDANRLLGEMPLPSDSSYRLLLNDVPLLQLPGTDDLAQAQPARGAIKLHETRTIANASQPMQLTVTRGLSLAQLFPAAQVIALLLLVSALMWLLFQYQQALREREDQARKVSLLERETQLSHAARVNALGEMASGIAHELSQPMTALLGQSQAAKRAYALDMPDVLSQALDANIREAKRAGDILGRMRAYIAGTPPELEVIALDRAIEDALQLVLPELTRRAIRLQSQVAPALWVQIDRIAFQQVLHNLLMNAADALADSQEKTILIQGTEQGPDHVQITVTDSGPGIANADLSRLFEPFFSTKPEGMGLGLPLSARLIEAMSGQLTAANKAAGTGAVFTIRLARARTLGQQR